LFTLNFALSISCQASPQQAKSSEQSLDLTVGVENWAGVSRTMLTSAEKAAGNVFRRVGIEVTWREISAASPPTAGAGATLLLQLVDARTSAIRSRRWDSTGREGQMTFEPLYSLTV